MMISVWWCVVDGCDAPVEVWSDMVDVVRCPGCYNDYMASGELIGRPDLLD